MTNKTLTDIIIEYHNAGFSNKRIADKFGMSPSGIRALLVRHGVYKNKAPSKSLTKMQQNKALLLLNKTLKRHEGGLLPDRYLYLGIKEFLDSLGTAI